MAATVNKYFYKGGFYRRGIADPQDTQSRVVAKVTISGGNEDALAMMKEAADGLVATIGTTHPNNAALPARSATAVWLSPGKAKVAMDYDAARRNVPVPDVNVSEAEVRTIQMYDWASAAAEFTDGTTTSANTVYDKDTGQTRNAPRIVEVPVQTVRLSSTDLSFAPIGSAVMDDVGKVNAATFEIGGRDWAAHEVRFDGCRQRYSKVGTASTFTAEWQYSCRIGGWYENVLTANSVVTQRLMYGTATLAAPPIDD